MAELTHRTSEIARYWVDLIKPQALELGFKLVRYGDARTFPKVPMLCIEPATSTHEYEGAPLQTRNTINIAFLVYHTGSDGVENIQFEVDVLSDDLADFMNKECTGPVWGGNLLNGLVTAGHVSSKEYGYRVLTDRLMRCNRLVWTGMNKTRLVEVA